MSSEQNKVPPPYTQHPGTGAAPTYGFQPPPQQPNMYPPPQQSGYPPTHPGHTAVIVQPQPQVVILNGCPSCRQGTMEQEFTCCGIFCGIFFFPLGLLCCLLMRERRCTNCGATVG